MEASMYYTDIIFAATALIFGLISGLYFIKQKPFDKRKALLKAEKNIADANLKSKTLHEEAKQRVIVLQQQSEIEEKEFTSQLAKMEKMLEIKSASCKKREVKIVDIKTRVESEEIFIKKQKSEIEELDRNIKDRLTHCAGMNKDTMREKLMVRYETLYAEDKELRLQKQLEWDSESAVRKAKNILSDAVYRFADAASVEHDQRKIIVPRDEIKGRIVGRGGRLIAFFEDIFGVDVIFNDEPNTIIVSCFNLVQEEIAAKAIERLIKEKNINEEIITHIKSLAQQDVDKLLFTEGEKALTIIGLKNMPADFIKLVGRLKFRTSYGQNIMRHCFEVAYFARMLASELGLNTEIAFLGGFFHDIGKAIDQEVGGSHDVLTKEILEKYGFSWEITHAAWTHHNAIPQETLEARIVQAADAISASRPGARAESVERYLAKINDLQNTALAFEGVRKAYAINAGRELRVIVEAEKIKDGELTPLAQNIASKVQEKGGYPGKIKIVTMRTTKIADYVR